MVPQYFLVSQAVGEGFFKINATIFPTQTMNDFGGQRTDNISTTFASDLNPLDTGVIQNRGKDHPGAL